jgi:hypothetical protein
MRLCISPNLHLDEGLAEEIPEHSPHLLLLLLWSPTAHTLPNAWDLAQRLDVY